MFDGQQLGDDIVGLVRGFMEREIAPLKAENAELKARLAALEAVDVPEVIKGEDGTSVTLDDVAPMIAAEVERAIAALPTPQDGKDAAGIVEALKDAGELVLTLQDGRLIRTGIRDGKDGDPGNDGLGFDDMDVVVLDDDRTIELSFRRGDEEKAFTLKWPTMIYRGVWSEGQTYQPGDVVTWGGSAHVAEEETTAKPETKGGSWRLAVKRGRDGKDAK
jgi:hypothetical protein